MNVTHVLDYGAKDLQRHKWSKDATYVIGGGGLYRRTFCALWRAVLDAGVRFAIFGVGTCVEHNKAGNALDPLLLESIRTKAIHVTLRDTPGLGCPVLLHPSLPPVATSSLGYVKHKHFTGRSRSSEFRVAAISYAQKHKLQIAEVRHMPLARWNDIMTEYRKYHTVICERYHGNLFGMLAGCKVVTIDWSDKCRVLSANLGLADTTITLPGQLPAALAAANQQNLAPVIDVVRRNLESRLAVLKQQLVEVP